MPMWKCAVPRGLPGQPCRSEAMPPTRSCERDD